MRLGTLFLSLLIALMLWGMAHGTASIDRGFDVPVVFAGVPDHLHVHVVPRWAGDTNFTTATANLRVLPIALDESWRRLRDAWPG